MQIQYNTKLTTKSYKAGQFTKEVKNTLAGTFNTARNWSKECESEFKTHIDFYQALTQNLFAFRFGLKFSNNSKTDVLNEVWGVACDLDKKGCSVSRTLKFMEDFNSIFYYSPNGTPGEDNTPHRLILFFDNPQSLETATRYAKQVSYTLQGESNCYDPERLWFPPMSHTIHLSVCKIGKGLESLPLVEIQDPKIGTVKTHQNNNLTDNTPQTGKKGLRTIINETLTTKVLELGFDEFFRLINIVDVEIKESKRKPENSGKIEGEALQRFDVKPPKSDSFDRVDCNLINNQLFFYDRRDGVDGYTGTFLKFLLACTGENVSSNDYKLQLDYSKELFSVLSLEFPEKPKKIEPTWLWCEFLSDHNEDIVFIDDSQKYGVFNGKFWELLSPDKLFKTKFIEWSIAAYGIIKASVLNSIRTTLIDITFGKIKTHKTKPIDRNLYPFNDGIFNSVTKEFLSFSPSLFVWYGVDYNYNDLNLSNGGKIWEKLRSLVSQLIIGDDKKHQNFLDGFALLCLDQLWRTQSMLWLYGEGGSGKSTIINWCRDMIGNASTGGRMADLRSQEIFNSPHSLQKIIEGTVLNLSEFSFPGKNDASFLKDIIASGATENSKRIRGGCAIPINEKFCTPYTAYWFGSVVATSQDKPKNDCILDSGWQRRLNFFSFKKIKEVTNIFKEIDAGLNDLFVYILNMDIENLIDDYNGYFRSPNPEADQQQELELSPVAAFLNDNTEVSNNPVSMRSLYLSFNAHRLEYGMNYALTLSQFEKYLDRYLSKFYGERVFIHDKVRSCNIALRVSKLKEFNAHSVTTSHNGNNNFHF